MVRFNNLFDLVPSYYVHVDDASDCDESELQRHLVIPTILQNPVLCVSVVYEYSHPFAAGQTSVQNRMHTIHVVARWLASLHRGRNVTCVSSVHTLL